MRVANRSYNVMSRVKSFTTMYRRSFLGGILATGLLSYMLGFSPLFLVLLLVVLSTLPVPNSLNSLIGRSVTTLLIGFSVTQVAALIQSAVNSAGGFMLTAVVATLLTFVLVSIAPYRSSNVTIATKQDIIAVFICVLIGLPLVGMYINNFYNSITTTGGLQVADAVAHEGFIANFGETETLGYQRNSYYPAGYHMATAFIEESSIGELSAMGWKARSVLFGFRYLIWLLITIFVVVKLTLSLIDFLKPPHLSSTIAIQLVAGGVVGGSVAILSLAGFIYLGFLNYYYICSALVIAALCVIALQQTKSKKGQSGVEEVWPIVLYLILTIGVSFSWPLWTPVILLTVCVMSAVIIYTWLRRNEKLRYRLPGILLVAALGLIHCIPLLLQVVYKSGNGQLINADGALHNFNYLFLLIGVSVLLFSVWKFKEHRVSVLTVLAPTLLLVVSLVIWQLITIGEVRYYAIKGAIVLELLFAAFIVAFAATRTWKGRWSSKVGVLYILIASTLIMVTVFTVPRPFIELRSLFRDSSRIQYPPFLKEDAQLASRLGASGKIQQFNTTILHFNQPDDKLYAHIGTAVWANAMSRDFIELVRRPPLDTDAQCFIDHTKPLAYGSGTSAEQVRLREGVAVCIQAARAEARPYYIITDPSSVNYLKDLFGEYATFLY